LSPLERRRAFFHIVEGAPDAPASKWLVPPEALENARLAVTPEPVTGYAILRYELSDFHLSSFMVPPIRPVLAAPATALR
jgi:hypothetical protein